MKREWYFLSKSWNSSDSWNSSNSSNCQGGSSFDRKRKAREETRWPSLWLWSRLFRFMCSQNIYILYIYSVSVIDWRHCLLLYVCRYLLLCHPPCRLPLSFASHVVSVSFRCQRRQTPALQKEKDTHPLMKTMNMVWHAIRRHASTWRTQTWSFLLVNYQWPINSSVLFFNYRSVVSPFVYG